MKIQFDQQKGGLWFIHMTPYPVTEPEQERIGEDLWGAFWHWVNKAHPKQLINSPRPRL